MMGGQTFSSLTTPELRTVPKIWICVEPDEKKIIAGSGDNISVRTYTDEDFSDQLTAAAIEERLR